MSRRVEGEIVINRPVDEVFDFVADERNEPRYNPKMRVAEQISDGPIGVGTRFRAETVSLGRAVEMVIEFTDFKRPRRIEETVHMSSMDLHGGMTFDTVAGGTRMRWSWDLEPRGGLRLMGPDDHQHGPALRADHLGESEAAPRGARDFRISRRDVTVDAEV